MKFDKQAILLTSLNLNWTNTQIIVMFELRDVRRTICKVGISNNRLNYYTGTKFNSSKLCSGSDLNTEETVKHIILYCSK